METFLAVTVYDFFVENGHVFPKVNNIILLVNKY